MLLCIVALPRPGRAEPEKLGKVVFPTSCDAKVQPSFERGVALLHSYWFTEARKVFDAVLQQDASCVMAYWGLAVHYLGNSLAAAPSAKDVAAASDALGKARAIGAKTQRERDWIEAIGAYCSDYDKLPLDARLAAYTRAMEQMTQRYPDDFEAWTYYALTLQASAPRSDKTYANQLKSAAILERLLGRHHASGTDPGQGVSRAALRRMSSTWRRCRRSIVAKCLGRIDHGRSFDWTVHWLVMAFVAGGVLAPVIADAADIRIEMRAGAYVPADVRGRAGDTLVFVNHDAVQHQPFVPTTGWGVNVGDIKPGGTASIPLARAGQFEIECAYHPGMRATVVVDR